MELPIELKTKIENELENVNIKKLQKDAESISQRYRNESGKGKRLLTENSEALSYAIVRMPATYAAVYTALKYTLELYDEKIETLLDVGAGTGAGSWAANNLLEINKITCLEREEAMLNLGEFFMHESEDLCLKNAEWKKIDLIEEEIKENADLVISSYVLNEMDENSRNIVLEKLWNATNKVLVIIEPGTPVGFKELKDIRKKLKNLNGNIIAPCPNIGVCPMPENDWCHSTCRVSRSKAHKMLKSGDVPYEDEKFSYIAVCKNKFELENVKRILRHPKIESGKIGLKLCGKEGIEEVIVNRKDKEMFKMARKAKCGDIWKG